MFDLFKKSCEKGVIFTCALLLLFSAWTFFAPSVADATNILPINQGIISQKSFRGVTHNTDESSKVGDDLMGLCDEYPGLVNKIVMCVNSILSAQSVRSYLESAHENFSGIAAVAMIFYILFFGLKLMLGNFQNAKKEFFVMVFAAVGIMYFNNAVRIYDVMKFFLLTQAEFVNAASAAITTTEKPIYEYTGNDKKTREIVGYEKTLCYGELNPDGTYNETKRFTVWQQVDCIIGYVLGAHPIVKYTLPDSDCSKDLTKAKAANGEYNNECYSYELFATNRNPFANMAEDPFKFLKSQAERKMTHETTIALSTVTLVGMMFFSDEAGSIMVLTFIFLFISLAMAFGQAMLVYITAIFAIIILSTFAPLILPCFLFNFTKRIFNFWLQMLITYTLQPGILMAYLTFMVFAMQYTMTYTQHIKSFDCKDPNENCDDLEFDFIDLVLGDYYQSAFKGSKEMIKTISNQDTYRDIDNVGDVIRKAEASLITSTDVTSTVEGEATSSDASAAEEGAEELLENSRTSATPYATSRSKGGSTSVVSKPSFMYMLNGDFSQLEQVLDDTSNQLDVDKYLSENMGIVQNMNLRDAMFSIAKQDGQVKLAVMQSLMVMLLVLNVTYAFMMNVMQFGAAMAGAGTIQVKMFSVFSWYQKKLESAAGGKS